MPGPSICLETGVPHCAQMSSDTGQCIKRLSAPKTTQSPQSACRDVTGRGWASGSPVKGRRAPSEREQFSALGGAAANP